jgi:hypothetical protein
MGFSAAALPTSATATSRVTSDRPSDRDEDMPQFTSTRVRGREEEDVEAFASFAVDEAPRSLEHLARSHSPASAAEPNVYGRVSVEGPAARRVRLPTKALE